VIQVCFETEKQRLFVYTSNVGVVKELMLSGDSNSSNIKHMGEGINKFAIG